MYNSRHLYAFALYVYVNAKSRSNCWKAPSIASSVTRLYRGRRQERAQGPQSGKHQQAERRSWWYSWSLTCFCLVRCVVIFLL